MVDPGNLVGDRASSSIKKAAEGMLNTRLPLITDKSVVPPSGNKKDFVSLSRYFWLIDGKLEYRDGQVNPKVKDYPDSENLTQAIGIILITSLAAESSENPEERAKFTNCAISTLRAWFIDEETRMVPSLEYAGMREGETNGNWHGIIEGQKLVHAIGGIIRLREGGLIDEGTLEGVKGWFEKYLSWLQESEKGKQAREAANNHSTFYDVQIAYIADFLEEADLARATLEGVKKRIESQIEPDGRMPRETERKIPYDYQLYNLFAFSELATLGSKYGVDLWHWETEDGRSLSKAFEYFADQLKLAGEKPFKMDRSGEFYLAYRAAAKAYGDKEYWDLPTKYYGESTLADEITRERFGSFS